jgi:hypothetical protein
VPATRAGGLSPPARERDADRSTATSYDIRTVPEGRAMKFNIYFNNHLHSLHVEDLMSLVRLLLEAAGHSGQYEIYIPGRSHIFVENFSEGDVEIFRQSQAASGDNVIVATEYVTGETFNNFGATESTHYADEKNWRERFRTFVACAQFARAIWVAADDPEQLEAYRAVVPGHVRVLPLPYPYFTNFRRLETSAEQDIDVLFSDTYTTYRHQMMNRFTPGYKTLWSGYIAEHFRQNFLPRTKICLGLRQSATWKYPSPMRCWYYLNHGKLILNEQCARPCVLDPFIATVPPESLPAAVDEVLQTGQWRPLANEARDKFEAGRPAKPAAEELLALTYSRG